MLNVFYRVLDIGIAALWMVIAVLILRLMFRKASSRVKCVMWGMVALRLLVPVIIESNFAITPYFSVQNIIEIDETVPETRITENMTDKHEPGKSYTDNSVIEDDRISDFGLEKKKLNDPITVKNGEKQTEYDIMPTFTDDDIRLSNNTISNDPENVKNVQIEMNKVDETRLTNIEDDIIAADNDSVPFYEHSGNDIALLFYILGYVWLLGATAFMLYGLYRFIRLRSRLKTAVLRENEKDVYLSEYAGSPFVFGIVKPKIYMGFGLSDISAQNVIKHERMHIRHRDHLLKILAYSILAVYWFLPWVWVAFILFCRDMELACDEAVIRDMDMNSRADYSQSLLECVKPHKKSFSYSVYFGENGIKRRIKNISGYKKKNVWITIAAVTVCGIVAVILFLTVPDRSDNEDTKHGKGSESSENADITKTAELSETDPVKQLVREIIEEKGEAGIISYYSEPTLLHSEKNIIADLKLSGEQAESIMTMLDNITDWSDDNLTNHVEYSFNGEIRLSDSEKIYYFDYAHNVICYDHYYAKVSFEDMQYVSNLQKGNEIYMFDYRLIIPGNPQSIRMTDITDLRLEDAGNEIMEPMKDFIEKFTKLYLLESFTQTDNSAIAEYAAQYLIKTDSPDIIKDDTAGVYRIPNETYDKFIEDTFYLEQELDNYLVRQPKSQMTLYNSYFRPPCNSPVTISSVKTDGNGYYYVFGSNLYKKDRIKTLKSLAGNTDARTGGIFERTMMLDFFAIVKDYGDDEEHDWKLYEWIINP